MVFDSSHGDDVIEGWNRVFRALATEPRRQVIAALNDSQPSQPVALPDAALSPASPSGREQMTLELQHNHLPLLEKSGFIEWTAEPFRAYRGPNFDEVAVIFEALYDKVDRLPDELVMGCRRLEAKREASDD